MPYCRPDACWNDLNFSCASKSHILVNFNSYWLKKQLEIIEITREAQNLHSMSFQHVGQGPGEILVFLFLKNKTKQKDKKPKIPPSKKKEYLKNPKTPKGE